MNGLHVTIGLLCLNKRLLWGIVGIESYSFGASSSLCHQHQSFPPCMNNAGYWMQGLLQRLWSLERKVAGYGRD